MRLFVAVDVGKDASEKLAAAIESVRQTGADASFSNPRTLYCTLAFLSEKNEKQAREVISRLSAVLFPRFTCNCRGLGFFPSDKFGRVFWAGLEAKELTELQNQVATALDYRDGKPFHPHVTLARIRSQQNLGRLVELAKQPADFGSFEVTSFSLMKSELSPQGAVHSTMAKFALL